MFKTLTHDHITDRSLGTSLPPPDPLDHPQIFYTSPIVTSIYPRIFARIGVEATQGVLEVVAGRSGQGIPRGDAIKESQA